MEIYEHNAIHMQHPQSPQKKDSSAWVAVVALGLACAALAVALMALLVAFTGRKSPSQPTQNDYASAYAAVRACAVEVYSPDNNGAVGSGVVYKVENGKTYVLTNFHVTGFAEQVQVRFTEFGEKIQGSVLGYDAYHDIALAEVAQDVGAQAAVRGAEPTVGTKILAVGNSLGYGMAAFDGIVSKTDRLLKVDASMYSQEKRVPVYAVTAPVNAGMSGGGLFTLDGAWVGVNTYQTHSVNDYDGTVRPVDGMSYSVPAVIADKIARQILHERSGGQIAKLDVTANAVNEDRIEFQSLYFKAQYTAAGLVVYATSYDADNPPASMQGDLPQEGDVVLAVGSLSVTADTGYAPLFAACLDYVNDEALAGAQTLTVTFLRDGKSVTVTYARAYLKNY